MSVNFYSLWILKLVIFALHRGESACPSSSSSRYAKVGETVQLQFQVDVNAKQFVGFEICTSDQVKIVAINYLNGVNFTALFVDNNVNFVGDYTTGDLSFEIPSVKIEDGRVYILEQDTITTIKCITLYVLGVPQKPVITPDNNHVVGLEMILTCSSKSTTKPNAPKLSLHYTWNVDNPDVTRYVYSQTKHTLTITRLRRTDSHKTFTCTAKESGDGVLGETSAPSSAFDLVLIYGPDASTTTLSPATPSYTRNEGDRLNDITCSSDCYPSCKYQWTKSVGNTVVSNNQKLSLGQLSRAKAATYTCTVTNINRTVTPITKTVTVVVKYGPDINSVTLDPKPTIYVLNEQATLADITCGADCYPSCNFKWMKASTNHQVSSTQKLQLGALNRNEADSYTCTATNPTSRKNAIKSVIVNVRYGPDRCEVSVPSQYSITEGETPPKIVCQSECYPACSYKWKNITDGTVISQTGTFRLETVSREQAGKYKCFCKNTASQYQKEETTSININVQYEASITAFFIEGHRGQTNVTVDENNRGIQFICEVDSNATSAVKILFDGEVLKTISTTNHISFIQSSVVCLDGGEYTCERISQYGQSSKKSIALFVNCSPRPLHQVRQNVTSALHAPVTLGFTALAYPLPLFAWSKENGESWTPILSNADLRISSSALQSNLTISNVSKADYGRYRLTVKNDMGGYVQYLFLEEDMVAEGGLSETCKTESEKTAIAIGISLGLVVAVLAIYSTSITIMYKRKTTSKDPQFVVRESTQKTYVNVAYKPNQTNDSAPEAEVGDARQYTDLVGFSRDDRTAYEVLHDL